MKIEITHKWGGWVSRIFIVDTISLIIHIAVKLLPYLSYPLLVAILTMIEAKAGPYSKSHSEHAATEPAKMSPIFALLFGPPWTEITKFFAPKIISFGPLIKSVNGSFESYSN